MNRFFEKIAAMAGMVIISMLLMISCASSPRYREGLDALAAGQYEKAAASLRIAAEQNPESIEISIALQQAKRLAAIECVTAARRSMDSGHYDDSRRFLESAAQHDPLHPGISELLFELENRRKAENLSSVRPQPPCLPVDLEPLRVSFDVRDMTLGEVFEALSQVAGINLLIDDSVDQSRLLSISLKEVDVCEVMTDIAAAQGLMIIELTSDTRILSRDSVENRTRYAREDVRLFPLQYADAERIRELLHPVIGAAVVLADRRTNSVVVRTDSQQIHLVADLIEALDIRESEVLVEVEILEVTRGRLQDIGLSMGDNAAVKASLGSGVKQSGSRGTLTISDLQNIGSGHIFVTVPSLYLNLIKNDSHTRVLAQPRLRILNRTEARLHIGEQVPIKVSSSQFRSTSEELSTYQYRDVGIVMNLLPRILSDSELALDLKLVVSSILQASEEGHPTIGTREVETTLRLRHDEVEIIAGLIKDDERKSRVRIPFLGDVPVLGRLFTSEGRQTSQTDIVISLKPHILDRRTMPDTHSSLWQGNAHTDFISRKQKDGRNPPFVRMVTPDGVTQDVPDTALPEESSGVGDQPSEPDDPDLEMIFVYVVPSRTDMVRNTESTVQIAISQAADVGSVPFYIDYNPTVLEVVDVREGPFMSSDGTTTIFLYSVDERRGRIVVGLSRVGAPKGIDGEGALVDITFKGLQPGESPVSFSHEAVLNPEARALPARFEGGDIIVRSESANDRQ